MTIHRIKAAKVFLGDKEIATLGDTTVEIDDGVAPIVPDAGPEFDCMNLVADCTTTIAGAEASRFWRDMQRALKESRFRTARVLDAELREGDPRRKLRDKSALLEQLRRIEQVTEEGAAVFRMATLQPTEGLHAYMRRLRMAIRRTERKIAKLRVALVTREFREATAQPMPHDDGVDALAYAIDVSARDQSLEYKTNVIRESPRADVRASSALPE